MSYEQTLKAVDDILRTDAGCATPIDYIEQTSWILFLKYLSDLESERSDEATLKGKEYTPLFTDEFKWDNWAVPKNDDGSQDIVNALTGDDLLEFVNLKLMPYLKTFKTDIENSNTLEYKIGEIFSEISNKLQSGYTLRDVLNNIDTLSFLSIVEKHEMSHLYEEKIKDMGNAGRSGGEYYTPRPLIQAIVEKVNPKIGETVYDPAVGSAGFLVEAFKHMSKGKLSVEDVETLQFKTFYGKEKKSLAYIIALMNMILHGVDAPNILHINTLTENVLDVQDSERHDVILANPPFGGKERKEVQHHFNSSFILCPLSVFFLFDMTPMLHASHTHIFSCPFCSPTTRTTQHHIFFSGVRAEHMHVHASTHKKKTGTDKFMKCNFFTLIY